MSIHNMKEALKDLEWEELSVAGRAALDVLRQSVDKADQAVREEREACAQLCEDLFMSDGHWCAKAIRARGEK